MSSFAEYASSMCGSDTWLYPLQLKWSQIGLCYQLDNGLVLMLPRNFLSLTSIELLPSVLVKMINFTTLRINNHENTSLRYIYKRGWRMPHALKISGTDRLPGFVRHERSGRHLYAAIL